MGDQSALDHPGTSIDLFWIPLGAGGHGFVRWNGLVYEGIRARVERRPRLDLYHTALEVHLPDGRFTIESAWPSPDLETDSRGVMVEGPVFSSRLMRFRAFRYEVRCWRDGVIPDAGEAVGGPQPVATDPAAARSLLGLVAEVPPLAWGRDPPGVGDMWNSNSVISWLLARSGLPVAELRPPEGGHAPGWRAGVAVASGGEPAGPESTRLGKSDATMAAAFASRRRGSNGSSTGGDDHA